MAHVNGNRYRTFGQGARRENEKAQATSTDSSRDEQGRGGESGSKTQISHHEESGEYRVKHEGETKTHKFGSKEEMIDHLHGHYPDDEHESEHEMGGEEGEGSLGGAVKSLLE